MKNFKIGGESMAQRGRKPKPTAVKELESNPGKRALNEFEPKPKKKAPKCPNWLDTEAKKEWRRVAKQLEELGVLTEVDMAAFAGYCEAYARWKEAEEFISKYGTIVKHQLDVGSKCRRYLLPKLILGL